MWFNIPFFTWIIICSKATFWEGSVTHGLSGHLCWKINWTYVSISAPGFSVLFHHYMLLCDCLHIAVIVSQFLSFKVSLENREVNVIQNVFSFLSQIPWLNALNDQSSVSHPASCWHWLLWFFSEERLLIFYENFNHNTALSIGCAQMQTGIASWTISSSICLCPSILCLLCSVK